MPPLHDAYHTHSALKEIATSLKVVSRIETE